MRVICDAPGQTCNRLWSYVASVAMCLAERRRMVIIFYDWTIEDFPHLLGAPFISYPLWHKWYLERGNGWNNYKGLTWKVTHNPRWDRVFALLGFTKGWHTRSDTRYLQQELPRLQQIFRPKESIMERASQMIAGLRQAGADVVVGVHVRRGDYATWNEGRFFFSLDEYASFMRRVQKAFDGQRVGFFISSNEDFDVGTTFPDLLCARYGEEPSAAILDLYTLSLCDRLIGPFSTFSRWASFIGRVPLCFIEHRNQRFLPDNFSRITDYFHFENGKEIADW